MNFKTDFPVKSVYVNDFLLKTMEISTARVDKTEFTFGVLIGMFERSMKDHTADITKLNEMRLIRRKRAQE